MTRWRRPSMPPHDPNNPAPPRRLTTAGGVEVIVKPPPPEPEPEPEPEPQARGPRAIIVPEGLTDEELKAFLNGLCKEHGKLVEELLELRKDILEESRKDLQQKVLMVLWGHVEETRSVPVHMRAWLNEVVTKEVRNHKDLWKPPVKDGADAEAEAVPAWPERGPEGTADLAERREKLERCLPFLPRDQAAVIRCVYLFDMTFEQTATATGKPLSTVFLLAEKAGKKLVKLMRALSNGASLADVTGDEET
jgi:DNA-directed RNA polymerase specialized sigma24 family protein